VAISDRPQNCGGRPLDQLVELCGKSVLIGPPIDGVATGLLGGHVRLSRATIIPDLRERHVLSAAATTARAIP